MTCFNILDQNLTCFEKLVSNCEAAQKFEWKYVPFSQKIIRINIREASPKCQLSRFHGVRWPKGNEFLKANFSLIFEFPQKNFFQNLKHSKIFGSKSDGCYKGWFEIWPALEVLIPTLMICWKLVRSQTRFKISEAKSDA